MSFVNTNILHKKSDKLGAISSLLCAMHCIATPFLFIAKSCSATCCEETPIWWKTIDVLFLIVSFIAIYYSTKNSTNNLIKIGLWVSFSFLTFIIINEHINIYPIGEWFIYIPAFFLVFLHTYNRKYCQCKTGCCNHK